MAAAKKRQSPDERALRRVLDRAVRRRRWPVVVTILNEIGELYEEEAQAKPESSVLPAPRKPGG